MYIYIIYIYYIYNTYIYIYIYGDVTRKLCSYLKQTKKMSFFPFFEKTREQEGGTGPAWGGWFQWERAGGGEREWEDEQWCKYCTHMYVNRK
jgi:hypothetical protein